MYALSDDQDAHLKLSIFQTIVASKSGPVDMEQCAATAIACYKRLYAPEVKPGVKRARRK